MSRRSCSRRELLDRWRGIQEDLDEDDPSPSYQRRIRNAKEEWFLDSFEFLVSLPMESHIWCGHSDLMGPLLETFHDYFNEKRNDSPLKLVWRRVSEELRQCTHCISQHHQAQETYSAEYELDTVGPLLKVLCRLDEERVTEHLKEINARISRGEYDSECHSGEVVSLMFEVLMFPILLDDQSLINEFQIFIEAIDSSHELTLAGHQQYPGVYALLFLKNGRARAIGLRLAGCLGKLRGAADLDPLQPLLKKYIGILETEVLPSYLDASRPRVQLERITVWLGVKSLLGFLEPPAFEEGILEKYPIFLTIVLNHISDDTPEFSYAVTCLKASFEMLGCKLWLRTSLSPSMIRNTLLGQCFHTRNEKSHKEIFDLFLPFLQSLEALQDGEHEKQRRHFLYFLLHQVSQSSNFSFLMRKNARKIALLIIQRGYEMNPPCPPFGCAHIWCPSLVCSLKDSSLHSSLRQPAFDLIQTIIISDASALIAYKLKPHAICAVEDEENPFFHDVEDKDNCSWSEFSIQSRIASSECKEWTCIPMLWFDVLVEVDPSTLPTSFSKAVFWALSHISMAELDCSMNLSMPLRDWLSSYAPEILSSFGWEVPSGLDDGDGKRSRNSVKVSSMWRPLLRAFRRLATHFTVQMEHRELQKQWTWEPRIAESLILLLIEPDDTARQVGRIVLEHVSKARGLTSGLQFLCSSATSLSATYLGLQCVLRKVQAEPLLANFHNLHHLFFIIRKILKEVVTSSEKNSSSPVEESKYVKFSSEGGFLRQPYFDQLPSMPPKDSINVVDMKSWESFSGLLSTIVWPSILKCLIEGRDVISSKNCQMTCVRLLEMLPVVFEKLHLSASKLSGNLAFMVLDVFDYKWLSNLVDWGKSSLPVISRHWKQCMVSLLNSFRGLLGASPPSTFGMVESILSCDTVTVDLLKEKILNLSVSLSNESSCTLERKMSEAKPLFSGLYSGRKISAPETCSHEGGDLQSVLTREREVVIVLSDDERDDKENLASPDMVALSCSNSSQSMLEALPPSSSNESSVRFPMKAASGNLSRDLLEPFPSRLSVEKTRLVSQEGNSCNRMSSELESSMRGSAKESHSHNMAAEIDSSVIGSVASSNFQIKDREKAANNLHHDIGSVRPYKKTNSGPKGSLGSFVCDQSSVQNRSSGACTDLFELEKEDVVIKKLVCDVGDDPLEKALDRSRSYQFVMTKPNISVPRRKVVQLQMPVNNKSGVLNKLEPISRRLKPPRLDDWYRSILEIDYFTAVGLSSGTMDKNKLAGNLKEVPLCFQSSDHYVEIFRPLVLEEFKAQLHNSFLEKSADDMCFGSLSILSVEKIDDFHLVRGRPDDSEPAASRGFSENDLVLLTKEPMQDTVQQIHVLGKVERRERGNKSRSTIVVIRFYLPNGSLRLNKVRNLLIERSKWCTTRIMSITSQLREFQALSSLHDIPMLPVILNPLENSLVYSDSIKAELGKLPQPMQKMLKSSFNNSQLQAISVSIGISGSRKRFQLSLIQGPPGTGKTRTIVGIVSAVLATNTEQKNCTSVSSCSTRMNVAGSNQRVLISQSAAIARAWQDAAFAKQMIMNAEKDKSGSTEWSARGRVLICAQSNAAVDELVSRISEGLYGHDGKLYKPYLVRVGNAKTVHPSSLPFFIDTLVDQRLAEDMNDPNCANNEMSVESSSSLRAKLEKVVDRIRFYESKRAKLNDSDKEISLEDGSFKEDDLPEISDAAIGAKLNTLYGQKKAICGELAAAHTREKKLSEESRSLKHNIRKSILREAQIVVTTLSGCGGDLYGVCSESASSNKFGNFSEQSLFNVIVIDEAAQALEPATLIPLQLLKTNGTKCIMVGDPKQLPATVLSNVASKFLYECSMFERLQRAGHPVIMLTEQYRMHPEICRFPALHFYDNKLLNGVQAANKSAPFHENPVLGPYMFFDIVDGREHHGKNTGALSLCNQSEAEAAVVILKTLQKRYSTELACGRIGVITPYRSQLSLLRSRFSSAFGSNVVSDMEFNTVDGFQGREVDILVLSTVRASEASTKLPIVNSTSIGFVADVRRMNVALTRAKISLWILGNARTLLTNHHWAALIENAKERNLFISVARPYKFPFERDTSLFRENRNFHSLDSDASCQVEGEFAEDAISGAQHAKSHSKKSGKKKGRLLESRLVQDSRSNGKISKPSSVHSALEVNGTAELASGSLMTRSIVPNQESISQKEKGKLTTVEDALGRSTSSKVEDKMAPVDKPLERNYDRKILNKKAQESHKFYEASASSKSNSSLPSSIKGSQEVEETSKTRPKDLIAARKRQRDSIDALLSSALIPSKKPEASLRNARGIRPPLAGSSRASFKTSKFS